MSPEEERRFVTREIRVVIAFVVIILVIWAFVPTCRADSTVKPIRVFVPLSRAAEFDSIVAHMGFVDGRIVFTCPVEIRDDSGLAYIRLGFGSMSANHATIESKMPELKIPKRTICRVDTTLGQMHEITCPEGRPGCAVLHFGRDTLTDTIYTDDTRCDTIPTVRARGLDSVYVLPHDSIVIDSIDLWRQGGIAIDVGEAIRWEKTVDTIKIPGRWEYFNWLNGKRVNMRRVK